MSCIYKYKLVTLLSFSQNLTTAESGIIIGETARLVCTESCRMKGITLVVLVEFDVHFSILYFDHSSNFSNKFLFNKRKMLTRNFLLGQRHVLLNLAAHFFFSHNYDIYYIASTIKNTINFAPVWRTSARHETARFLFRQSQATCIYL